MLVSINWLKKYIDFDLSPEELAEKITMSGVEVEEVIEKDNDAILNLAPTANRGDCFNIIGVAREVGAILSKDITVPDFTAPKGTGKMSDKVEVIVKDQKASPRYTSRVIEGVKIGPSPDWLRIAVESTGTRSINNIVDATNYVLMEMGQPVHAFDLRFIESGKLVINKPKKSCKLMTLDGIERTFDKEDLLNLDGKNPIGAAGIMGGEHSGVLDDTTTVVLESAYFDPTTVRRTSKRTGLVSESSRRFEKGVDPEGVIKALHRLTDIIVDVAGGVPSEDWVDIYPKTIESPLAELKLKRIEWLLGAKIEQKQVVDILERVGCNIEELTDDILKVKSPGFRPDLTRPIDLIEEVARLFGYDKIETTMPRIQANSLVKPEGLKPSEIVKDYLVGNGFYEALTYGFGSDEEVKDFSSEKEALRLANPLTSEMVCMRPTIVPALLKSLHVNISRQINDVKLFEISKVFFANGKDLPIEKTYLAGAITGMPTSALWNNGRVSVDLFDAKAAIWGVFDRLNLEQPEVAQIKNIDFLHPVDSFEISYNGEKIGYCGRLHPDLEKKYDFASKVYVFEVNFDVITSSYLASKVKFKGVSKYPIVTRDIAVVVDSGVTHKEFLQSFNKYVNKLVQHVELFDIYSGKGVEEGKKSMAYRICFGSDEKTLSDEEVDQAFNQIIENVTKSVNGHIR